jgi:large subunit ribosomal protein L24e
MPKCSYCGKDYDIPRGLTFVLPNGDLLYFCSSKCRKGYKMGRRGDKQNWIRKTKKTKVVEEKK